MITVTLHGLNSCADVWLVRAAAEHEAAGGSARGLITQLPWLLHELARL